MDYVEIFSSAMGGILSAVICALAVLLCTLFKNYFYQNQKTFVFDILIFLSLLLSAIDAYLFGKYNALHSLFACIICFGSATIQYYKCKQYIKDTNQT